MRLNPEQDKAVKYIGGPVLVLAGAGSGKTGVITQKISYLIRECGYNARQVVALTFTNKAAREMKTRVSKILKKNESKGLWISTFHTLGLRILKEDSNVIGINKDFSIFDSKDSFEVLKSLTKLDDASLKTLQSAISNYKNDFAKINVYDADVVRIAESYNKHLLALNAVDFDDLIIHCLHIFANYPEILSKWQTRVRYLLVDEYQDTNQSQYQLVKYLIDISGHFTAVGDDDQSIYSWRGAQAENLKLLSIDYPKLKVIKLEQNYRCDHRILSASNALIANNSHIFEKKLWSEIENGEAISVYVCHSEDEEAQTLITNMMTHMNKFGSKFSEYAVLYRGNFQSRAIEKQLRMQRIPYVINGSTSFFEHTEIRDLIAYLRLIVNPDDQNAFVRIINTPKREIGTATLEKLSEYARGRQKSFLAASLEYGLHNVMPKAAAQKLYEFATWLMSLNDKAQRNESPLQILDWVIGDTEYLDYVRALYDSKQASRRIGLIDELKEWIAKLTEKEELTGLSDVLQRMQLIDMLDRKSDEENQQDSVTLMTLHAAKGLEFPYVFIVGLEEGLLPHQNCLASPESVEEERRLLYVGMTRTKRKLWMSLARHRKMAGSLNKTKHSRFLDELPRAEIDWDGVYDHEMSPDEKQQKMDNLFSDLLAMVEEN